MSSLSRNAWALEAEVKLNYLGRELLRHFYSHVRASGTDFSDGMCILPPYRHSQLLNKSFASTEFVYTDILLAEEYIDITGYPSQPSGVSKNSYQDHLLDEPDCRVLWILEPKRSTEVQKYSGTLNHLNKQDLRTMTMNAFAHFTYLWTKGDFVFVDLQGRLCDTS
jgi:hypothetical protein